MKSIIYFPILLLAGLALNCYGQKIDSQKQKRLIEFQQQKQQRNFYRKTLQVDSVKAEQVLKVQDNYKASLKLVEADTALKDEVRRTKVRELMEQKNQQLRQLLTPAQQRKIIPSTELAPAKTEKQPK